MLLSHTKRTLTKSMALDPPWIPQLIPNMIGERKTLTTFLLLLKAMTYFIKEIEHAISKVLNPRISIIW